MGKLKTDKGRLIDDAFRREAVRLLVMSGRTLKEVADDLGVGVSSLGAWKRKFARAELMSGPHEDVEKEVLRLRRENELLRAERDLLKKSDRLLCQGDKSMRFALIDAKKAEIPIETACAVLGVSVSGFYAWKSRPASARQSDDMLMLAHVRAAFAASNETYGSRRMHAELTEHGLAIGRRRVARLMRENGLKARQKTRFRQTTDSDHGGPVAANVLDRDFTATAPDQKWGVDISYVWTAEGWLYLAIVVDLFSRRIVGWQLRDRMKKGLALDALRRAIALRRPPAWADPSFRPRQSGQTQLVVATLRDHGFVASMSGRGNCYDNATVETVFKTLKSELIWRTAFTTRAEASHAIGHYIEGFYNPRRRHSSLGYISPAAFEAKFHVDQNEQRMALH